MNIVFASLVVIFLVVNVCSATFHEILRGLHSVVSWSYGALRHENSALPSQEKKRTTLDRHNFMNGHSLFPTHRKPQLASVVEENSANLKPEAARPSPIVEEPPSAFSEARESELLQEPTAPKSASFSETRSNDIMTDLKIPGGESPDDEDLPDVPMFKPKPQEPLDDEVPFNSLTEDLPNREIDNGINEHPNHAREIDPEPFPRQNSPKKKQPNQLALDVKDLFQVIE